MASPDYVRFQNCATGTLTDKDTGAVLASSDDLCSWMRVRDELPSVGVAKVVRTNPVVVGKTASFGVNGSARTAAQGGKPTPFTIADLLPEGFDIDDASQVSLNGGSPLTNPDGSKYDLSKVQIEITKNYNGTGRTLLRMIVPDPVEGSLYTSFDTTVKSTAPAGQTVNQAMTYMPGDGAKDVAVDKSLRNTNYCSSGRDKDTFDVNGNGSTEDYLCSANANFNVATTPWQHSPDEGCRLRHSSSPGRHGCGSSLFSGARLPLAAFLELDQLDLPVDQGEVGSGSRDHRGSRLGYHDPVHDR